MIDEKAKNQLRDLRERWSALLGTEGDIIPLMRESLDEWKPSDQPEETGTVETVGDGIATVSGLPDVAYGEILIFDGGIRGMVQNMGREEIGCILFGDDGDIVEGSSVHRTGKTAGIPVGDEFVGRVIDSLGNPIDGKGKIHADDYLPVESPAPGIIDRASVNSPMQTGLLAIDSMFPIGKGQRELIIGDRVTGKTTIAVDTILNQKGKGVICIYVAIGQKASSVAQLCETLRRGGAMQYSTVVVAGASDSAPMQYIAPYAGCAMGEYFMNSGRDVLIVYDDLSKHAIAYRSMSLLLERSPGREAYPGDVFYLHSRLLERSAHLSEERGGGSMTALPIVETQAGDVSAYIPTNVISITDGQIYLETELFHSGIMPAVNPGISVSRVGGNAQIKAMKKVSGKLKLAYSQYRELQAFAQFGSDLDEDTKTRLAQGERIVEVLKQEKNAPVSVCDQVMIIYAVINDYLAPVKVSDVHEFERELFAYAQANYPDIAKGINETGELSPENEALLIKAIEECRESFLARK